VWWSGNVGKSMGTLGYILLAVGAAFIFAGIGQGHLPYHDLAAVLLVPGVSLKGRPTARRRRRRTYLSDFAMRC
jgi:hypothetical protein